MSLSVDDFLTELGQQLVKADPDISAELLDAIKNKFGTAIGTAIYNWLAGEGTCPGAEVSFDVGDFDGTDDGGDQPTNITASGGRIS